MWVASGNTEHEHWQVVEIPADEAPGSSVVYMDPVLFENTSIAGSTTCNSFATKSIWVAVLWQHTEILSSWSVYLLAIAPNNRNTVSSGHFSQNWWGSIRTRSSLGFKHANAQQPLPRSSQHLHSQSHDWVRRHACPVFIKHDHQSFSQCLEGSVMASNWQNLAWTAMLCFRGEATSRSLFAASPSRCRI